MMEEVEAVAKQKVTTWELDYQLVFRARMPDFLRLAKRIFARDPTASGPRPTNMLDAMHLICDSNPLLYEGRFAQVLNSSVGCKRIGFPVDQQYLKAPLDALIETGCDACEEEDGGLTLCPWCYEVLCDECWIAHFTSCSGVEPCKGEAPQLMKDAAFALQCAWRVRDGIEETTYCGWCGCAQLAEPHREDCDRLKIQPPARRAKAAGATS